MKGLRNETHKPCVFNANTPLLVGTDAIFRDSLTVAADPLWGLAAKNNQLACKVAIEGKQLTVLFRLFSFI